jgi:hypothetical protein
VTRPRRAAPPAPRAAPSAATVARRWSPLLAAAALIAGCGTAAAGTPGRGRAAVPVPGRAAAAATPAPARAAAPAARPAATRPARPARPARRRIVVGAPEPQTRSFRALARVAGRPAVWIARRDGATLLLFDQRRTRLVLHPGTLDPGPGPYGHGPAIAGSERRRVLAAFNGGFRLNTSSGGFLEHGQVARPLVDGFGSVVIYRDGRADVGAWHRGVPAAGRRPAAVRQNLQLLVAERRPAASAASCVQLCWGASLGGQTDVARSGLGVTARGRLVWAAGGRLSPSGLARALIAGGAVRAVELDINPQWVAGYAYRHDGAAPVPEPVVPGQFGVTGGFLTPYSRDFFAVFAR